MTNSDPIIATTWAAPSWAVDLNVIDDAVTYSLDAPGDCYGTIGNVMGARLDPQLTQRDRLDLLDPSGSPRIVRLPAVIEVDGIRLTVGQARTLAEALLTLVAAAQA